MSPGRPLDKRGLAAAMAQTGTHHLSPYAMEAYRQCGRGPENWSRPNLFDHAKHNANWRRTENTGLTSAVMAFNNPRAYPGPIAAEYVAMGNI